METKDLKKMSRYDLLEILVEQSEKIEELEAQLEEARQTLNDRTITIAECGSMAEAALKINGVFKSVDNAASQYLENIKRISSSQEMIYAKREAESQRKASEIIADAEKKSEALISEAKYQAQNYWEEVYDKVKALIISQKELKQLLYKKGLIDSY